MTGGCFGPVLVRFLSIRRPAAAERNLHTEKRGCGRMESQDDARVGGGGRERDPHDEKGRAQERGITQGGTTAGMLRERNKEEERKGRRGGGMEKERKRKRRQSRR